jgi:hypothetical protein
LGKTNGVANVFVAYSTINAQNPIPNAYLTLYGTLKFTNMGTLRIADQTYNNNSQNINTGIVDFTQTTISSDGITNRLQMQNLYIGGLRSEGTLKLPSGLTNITLGNLYMARSWNYNGATLDLGANSQLRSLVVTNGFYLGYGAKADILGWPTNVDVVIGRTNNYVPMYLGWNAGYSYAQGALALTNGSFVGYLSELTLAYAQGGASSSTGRLDLTKTRVQIGDETNKVKVAKLGVGVGTVANTVGFLKLPPEITDLDVGALEMGGGYNLGSYCEGVIDFGVGTCLTNLSITNSTVPTNYFFYGCGGIGRLQGLPTTNWTFSIGQPARPAIMRLASRTQASSGAILAPTGCAFSAYLCEWQIADNVSHLYGVPSCTVDLRQCSVKALVVTGDVTIAADAAAGTNKDAKAFVFLPAIDVSFGRLFLGNLHTGSKGLLDLNGTRLAVTNYLKIGDTGIVSNHMAGGAGGLDLTFANTNNFVVGTNGRIRLSFEADPTNLSDNVWALRMVGDQRPYFQALTNLNKLTWITNGLSGDMAAAVGIYYDVPSGKTYVGIPGSAIKPTIDNRAPTNVTLTSACLNGFLSTTGTHPTVVSVYWGNSEGGDPSSGNWQNTNAFASQQWGDLSYPTTNVTLAASNTFYYYRYYASSLAGASYPPTSTVVMAGDVWITAPDAYANEIGPDPGTFTVWRVSSNTNAPILVNYTIGGTALYGTRYGLNPLAYHVTIPAGADNASIAVNPLYTLTGEPTQTVVLTLAPGAYTIAAPSSDTVYISGNTGSTITTTTDCGPWLGAGLGDLWSEAANWYSNASPALSYTGRIVFITNDLGNVNAVETNRTINGTAQSASYGLHYNINSENTGAGHTTDLGGNTLTLNGGTLQVGYNVGKSIVSITNGTLQLGAANRADVYVGANLTNTYDLTGSVLTVSATINVANVSNVWIGYSTRGNGPGAHGVLDLSKATIRTGSDLNRMVLAGNLNLAQNSGSANTMGALLLPPSLISLEVGDMALGYERESRGTLDFGAGSSLTSLTVRGNFNLGYFSSLTVFTNFPANVNVTVGLPAAASVMRVGTVYYDDSILYVLHSTSLRLNGGRFTGYLYELDVGFGTSGNDMSVEGILDLSTTDFRIGPAANMIAMSNLYVSSKRTIDAGNGNKLVNGLLKIPPAVTNITVGTLMLGAHNNCRGRLDIGTNSQLKALIVTNGLYFGGGEAAIGYDTGSSFVEYLPTGIEVRIGRPAGYVHAQIGRRHPGQYPLYGETYGNTARLVVSNGIFAGYFSRLWIGMKENLGAKTNIGILDLRNAALEAFEVGSDVYLARDTGELSYYGATNMNLNGYGYLYLPAGTATIGGSLYVGETNTLSQGWLELFGTGVTVSNKVGIYVSGVVTTHVYSAHAGLDLVSSSTNDFTISTNGRVHLSFEAFAPTIRGLRMAGDQTSFFQHLRDTARLTWNTPDGKDPQIIYNGAFTAVRLPPVPGTVFSIF